MQSKFPLGPNTDTALMMALAHILIKNQSYDKDFILKYTVGFDSFADYVLGEKKIIENALPNGHQKLQIFLLKQSMSLADKIITKKNHDFFILESSKSI